MPPDLLLLWDRAIPFEPAAGSGGGVNDDTGRVAFDAVLAAGEPTAIFRNLDAIQYLARLKVQSSADFAVARAALKDRKVRMADLDATLAPLVKDARQAIIAERGQYFESGGRTFFDPGGEAGPVVLAEFTARIVEEVILDDGAECYRRLALSGQTANGRPLARAEVTPEEFDRFNFVTSHWGAAAIVHPGQITRERMRTAVQTLSDEVPLTTIYTHTGWGEISGHWFFLTAGGGQSVPWDVRRTW